MILRTLGLTRYEELGASSRYRFLQYLPYLSRHGVEVHVNAMLDNAYVSGLYQGNGANTLSVAKAYGRRLANLLRRNAFDLIWIEKEALPFVPGWLEAALIGGKTRYVLDYDDAVFHNYDQHSSRMVQRVLGQKYDRIMRGAEMVIAGNAYIAERARASGAKRVEIVPTVVDLRRYATVDQYDTAETTIGWIGTPRTARYLDILGTVIPELDPSEGIRFATIGSGPLDWADERITVTPWSQETEVESLRALSVGIMPLVDSPFERGKCGLKLIQYMAVGLPVIASPVGVNCEIVEPGVNGFLCSTPDEWLNAIRRLAADPDLRRRLGQAGRAKVEKSYSLEATAPRLASLLREAAGTA